MKGRIMAQFLWFLALAAAFWGFALGWWGDIIPPVM
jgi:hypothetical protein